MSTHDGIPSCGHISHGCGHLPSTTRGLGHKRVFTSARDFASLQQGGFANKHNGFKLPSRCAGQLP
jgi:hypothetical protein